MPAEYPETDPEVKGKQKENKEEAVEAYQLSRRTRVLHAVQAALAISTPLA